MSENPYQAPREYCPPTRPRAPLSRGRAVFYLLASQTFAGVGGRLLADMANLQPGIAFAFASACLLAAGIVMGKKIRARQATG